MWRVRLGFDFSMYFPASGNMWFYQTHSRVLQRPCQLPLLKQFFLITAKPAMFVGNVAEDGFDNNPFLERLREYAALQNAPVVAICAKLEAEMSEMSDEDRDMFLAELGQSEPGLNRLIRAAYALLGLQKTTRWKVIEPGLLQKDAKQRLDLRFRLDLSQLPQALQFGSQASSDWNLSLSHSFRLEDLAK